MTVYEALTAGGSNRVVSEYDLNPDVTQLSYSTGPGGFNGLTVGLRDPGLPQFGFLPQPVALRGFNHVVLERNGVLVWEGRIMRPPLTGGEVSSFTAQGYGTAALTDDWYASADGTKVSAGPLLAEILALTAPLLTVSPIADEFVDTGIQYARSDFNGLPPSQVVQRMSTDGGGQGGGDALWDFLVYNGRRATFTPRVAPPSLPGLAANSAATGPMYWIDFDSTVVWDPDYTDCVGDVTVADSAVPPLTYQAVSSTFADRFGFMRRVYLPLGTVDATVGTQHARTYLALHEIPMVACTVTRDAWCGLRLADGAEGPLELVRAGQWMQVGTETPVMIVGTQVDANAGTLTVNANNFSRDYLLQMLTLENMTRLISLGLSPLSGAPK